MTNRFQEDYIPHRGAWIATKDCNCKWCLKASRKSRKAMKEVDNLLRGKLE